MRPDPGRSHLAAPVGSLTVSGSVPAVGEVVASVAGAALASGRFSRPEVSAALRRAAPLWPADALRQATDAVLHRFEGLGVLQPLLDDPSVSEVMVNGEVVWVERQGRLERTSLRIDAIEVQRLVERLVGPAGVRVDRASPIVDVHLPDGSRANVVLPPVALDGACITIRRFVLREATLADFASPPVADLLADAVRRRCNLVVSGGTGSGKTTLLNALAAHLGPDERIVTIEDTAELRLGHPHVVRLQSRRPNTEGVGEVTIRALVRTALRMRPDRIIVGEARGDEVMDMVQAMNSGHEGSMSTCHANSTRDALRRLEALALLGDASRSPAFVRDQLAAALRVVVHVARAEDGKRRVREVIAVGADADWQTGSGLHPLVRAGLVLGGDERW